MEFSWYKFKKQGLHYLNQLLDLHATVNENVVVFLLKIVCVVAIGLSVTMMIIGDGGPLYGSLRLPIIWNLKILAEDPSAVSQITGTLNGVATPKWLDPEQGLHWISVLTYAMLFLFFLVKLPQRGMTSLHTVIYTMLVSAAALVVPFEWIYVPLFDFFHNVPTGGWGLTTIAYGYWNWPKGQILNSVIGRNGLLACGLIFAYIIAIDNYHFRSFFHLNFNRKSLYIFSGMIAAFAFWVLLPAIFPSIFNVAYKGMIWFPQDIYVQYGAVPFEPGVLYDIIKEWWVPGGIGAIYGGTVGNFTTTNFYFQAPSMWYGIIMRVTNEVAKSLSIVWIAYTFLPTKKTFELK